MLLVDVSLRRYQKAVPVPNCSQAGIIGAVAGTLDVFRHLEAIKYLLGNREIADGQDACDGWINDEYKSS